MPQTSERARLSRDRPTWLIYLQLGAFATYLYGLSAAVPLLRIDERTSAAVAGLHGTAMAVATIAAGLALPFLTGRYGRRTVTWLGVAGMNAGVVLVVFSSSLPFTLLGYAVAGGFGSLMLYAAMAALSDHHGPAGAAAITEANAVGVVIGSSVTFLISAMANTALGWRAALLVTPLLTLAVAAALGRVWTSAPAPPPERVLDPAPGPGWRFHVSGAVLCCCVALEFSFNLWAASLLAARTGLSVATAATGLSALIAGMAAGRFAGAQLALRVPHTRLFTGALAVAGAGWLIFWMATEPVLGYAGLALSGLGISLHFPLALSAMIGNSGGRPDLAAAASPMWAGAAMAVGPFVLGALADGFGTRTAFLLVPVLIGLAVGGVLTARRRS
ncbi:MFS transporter [Nonomuraea sp. NPDC050536]|uniref:MFS transporter n=1 Tax=Nonomuraea sp. NPDC050536 TaxID=3364366 RepID=UPI0037C68F90